jgi:hypothetical protein
MTFIIDEDKALKTLLSGITVSDSGNATRPVAVFYGQPDVQIRQQAYPYITIELTGVTEEVDRAHRGNMVFPFIEGGYVPEGAPGNGETSTSWPIPVALYYQVTTYARQPRHDRQLIAALYNNNRLPFRFGSLTIPEDGTLRRLDMLGFVKRDTTESDKRLFSNVYNIRVSAEVLPDALTQLYKVLENPTITYTVSDTPFTKLNV